MTLSGIEAWIDFILLDMIAFDIIFSMNWLSLYYVIQYYFAKIVGLAYLDFTRLK